MRICKLFYLPTDLSPGIYMVDSPYYLTEGETRTRRVIVEDPPGHLIVLTITTPSVRFFTTLTTECPGIAAPTM